MKLIPVEAVPKRRGRHHLQDLIEEFVKSDDKVVKIDLAIMTTSLQRSAGRAWASPRSNPATPSRCRFVKALFT